MDPKDLCFGCMEASNGVSPCPSCGYVAGTAPDSPLYLTPGTVLREQYLVGRVVGHGGFGITYIGWDLDLARKIAVKEYFPSGVAMRTAGTGNVFPFSGNLQKDYEWGLERYLDEARVVARFHNHPNIVWVQAFFRANGTAYIVLEYLDGVTFEQFLQRKGGSVPWDTALQIMMPVMDALREVHRVEILHRDISPDNVYILRNGQVKLIDFGAARYALGQQSKNLSIILKEGYAPEEQYRSKGNQGPWTDVYASAATLYRAITGRIPPPALDRQRQDELEPPSTLGIEMKPAQEQALLKGLAVHAENRFSDVAAFQLAVMAEGGPTVVPAPQPSPTPQPEPAPTPPPPPPPRPKFPVWLMAAAGVVAMIVAAAAYKVAHETIVDDGSKKKDDGKAIVDQGDRKDETKKKDDVPPRGAAKILFNANTLSIRAGQSVQLTWGVTDADGVSINGQKVPVTGSANVSPRQTETFTLTARGLDGVPRTASVQVEVTAPDQPKRDESKRDQAPPRRDVPNRDVPDRRENFTPPPVRVEFFQASPREAMLGQFVTLSWSVTGADRVMIVPDVGVVPVRGQRRVQVRASVFVLTAEGASGQRASESVEIQIQRTMAQPPVIRGPAWPVGHDHQGGVLGAAANRYEWPHCEGQLAIAGGRLRFVSSVHPFDVELSDILEVKVNRIPIRGQRAFHVKFRNGSNFNFISNASVDSIVSAIQAAR